MASERERLIFGRARIDDRQVSEVLGIAHGIIADGVVNESEVRYLEKWLAARSELTGNPVANLLKQRVHAILEDGIVDDEETRELMVLLTSFAGGDFELGEATKSTSLPLCDPVPTMAFAKASICFTGTFAFGSRRDCEAAATRSGSVPGSLTMLTRYLVVGAYATDSWIHSAFGRKIEKAVEFRNAGRPINIVGEMHWTDQMRASGYLVEPGR